MTALQHLLFFSSTTEGEENRYSSCWETVSPLFLTFGFPLRRQVSLLFLVIKTKAAVRDAAGSWKLGVKSNEACFFADWPIVVLIVSGRVDKLTWWNKWHRGN